VQHHVRPFAADAAKKGKDVMKSRLFPIAAAVLAVALASPATAGTSWNHLGVQPFSRAPLASEADLRDMVRTRGVDLKAGFAAAGDPAVYPALVEQFPTAKIDTVKVAPGQTFPWMVFQKKKGGKVAVLKDVTWKGAETFDAFRFHIDQDGKRHEFLVPYACGNVALSSVGPIPPAPVAAAVPPPPVPAPPPVAPPPPARAAPAPVAVVPPPPPPVAPPPVAVVVPPPAPAPPPVAAAPRAPAPVPAPAPAPVAAAWGGLLFDVGLSRQLDPANYVFARVGYELPLSGKLYLIGLVGGQARWMGNDGGSAFTADAMLDYHWAGRFSFGLGAGYWSGNDGQVDALADVGYLLSGSPDRNNMSIFAEARLPFDELDNVNEFGRIGLGLRFRF
jgi:hypothetical protein